MNFVVLIEFLVGAGSCLAGSIVGLLLGATYGGNNPLPFQFGDFRGYEAGGMLGAVIGGIPGAALGAFLGSRLLSHAGYFVWSLCGAVLGAVPVVCILFLLTGVWYIALLIIAPGGAVLGLEVGKRLRNPPLPGKN